MSRQLQQIKAWYAQLDARGRRALFAGFGLALAFLAAVLTVATWTTYSPIVSGTAYDQVLEAAAGLDEQDIPYRIRGTTLSVPSDQVGAARAAIRSRSPLPGLDDVSELKLGLTPTAQDWAFLRQAEGDIARMINDMDDVAASQVNVVPREESLFFGEEREARASVFVKLRPDVSLDQAQIRSITNLVASSVEGLSPRRVTVADNRGNLLASGDEDGQAGMMGGAADLFEYRSRLERQLERSVGQALLPLLGMQTGFAVTAAVDLDLTSSETTSRDFDPDRQAVLSEQLEETASERAGEPRGLPGVDANLPEREGAAEAHREQASRREASTLNFVYPRVDEVRRRPAGGIERLSVAVQVDEGRLQDLVAADPQGRDAEALKRDITNAVRTAVGYQPARQDAVTVSFLPFAETEWVEDAPAASPISSLVDANMGYGVLALGLILFFVFVVRPLIAAATTPPPPPVVEEPEEQEEPEPQVPAAASHTGETDELARRLQELASSYQPIDSSDVNKLVENEADGTAEVIRLWNRR